MTNKVERLIDANYNRLKEALRLLEDSARFIFDNKELSYAFKNLRHNLTTFYSSKRVKHRDIINDVSKSSTDSEMQRLDLKDLIEANFYRAFESSRVLEEAFKLTNPKHSAIAKEIRYKLYNLHKLVLKELDK
jgi:thiamine-phosphate pyrophosphorylase